jgi:hypothetical protein
MKNHEEILRALLDGKKLKHRTWGDGKFIRLDDDGMIRDQWGRESDPAILYPERWRIFEGKKMYKFYTHYFLYGNGEPDVMESTVEWDQIDEAVVWKLLKTEVKEIEG